MKYWNITGQYHTYIYTFSYLYIFSVYCESGFEVSGSMCAGCARGSYKNNSQDVFGMCQPCPLGTTTAADNTTSAADCSLGNAHAHTNTHIHIHPNSHKHIHTHTHSHTHTHMQKKHWLQRKLLDSELYNTCFYNRIYFLLAIMGLHAYYI